MIGLIINLNLSTYTFSACQLTNSISINEKMVNVMICIYNFNWIYNSVYGEEKQISK